MTRANELGYDRLFIGGQWCDPSTSAVIEVHSPHDGRLIGSVPEASQGDVVRAVAAARQAMDAGVWALTPPEERQAVIRRFDELHHTRSAEFAALITAENGSPIWFTSMLQDSLTNQTGAYLRAAGELGWEERRPFPGGSTDVVFRHEPVGVVAAVVPALLAGNSVILKLAPETALDGMALGDLLREAGLPDDVFSVLPAGREVSEYLVSRSDVDKIAVRPPPAVRSARSPANSSSGSAWNSAESRPRSCCPTPTSTAPSRGSSTPRSPTTARPASPTPGSCCPGRGTP